MMIWVMLSVDKSQWYRYKERRFALYLSIAARRTTEGALLVRGVTELKPRMITFH